MAKYSVKDAKAEVAAEGSLDLDLLHHYLAAALRVVEAARALEAKLDRQRAEYLAGRASMTCDITNEQPVYLAALAEWED